MNSKMILAQIICLTVLFALTLTAQAENDSLAHSAGLFVYPAKDQSKEQQSKDDYECFTLSKKHSGYDPMKADTVAVAKAPAAEPKKKKRKGKRLKGAARGAAAGAVIDEIHEDDIGGGAAYDRATGNDNKAAKTGAVVGAARAGRKDRRAQKSADPAPSQPQVVASKEEGASANFKKAFSACLGGRGYSVE